MVPSIYWWLCLFYVCLSVRTLAWSNIPRPIFNYFCEYYTCGHGLIIMWWRCDTLNTSGKVDDIMFYIMGPMGQNQAYFYILITVIWWRHQLDVRQLVFGEVYQNECGTWVKSAIYRCLICHAFQDSWRLSSTQFTPPDARDTHTHGMH